MLITDTLSSLKALCLGKNYTLPADCYTSEDFLALERENIFRQGWICLGRTDEVPSVGDYFTASIAGEPVLVVRSDDTTISVYANVCRHRAMPVARGAGNVDRFVCPYHAWTYNIDGTLKSAPLMRKEVKLKNCRLPQVNSACWQGFIFASLSNEAPPLNEALSGLESVTGNYQMQSMHYISDFSEVWDCNWKSLTENFMDGYHLSVVHPESLRPLTPTNLCDTLAHGDAYTSYTAKYARTAPERHCHAATLNEEERRQSRLFCIYPAMMASVSPDTLVYFSLQPKGVAQVQVKWGISVFEAELSQSEKQQRIEKWQKINSEDHAILSELQTGLHSSFYQGGVLAPARLEGCISHFHDYLIRTLL